jgi:hypothetical protein
MRDQDKIYSIEEAMKCALPGVSTELRDDIMSANPYEFTASKRGRHRQIHRKRKIGDKLGEQSSPFFVNMDEYFDMLEIGIKDPKLLCEKLEPLLCEEGKKTLNHYLANENIIERFKRDRVTEEQIKAHSLLNISDHAALDWEPKADYLDYMANNLLPLFRNSDGNNMTILYEPCAKIRSDYPLNSHPPNDLRQSLFAIFNPTHEQLKGEEDHIMFCSLLIPYGPNQEANLACLQGVKDVVDVMKSAPGMKELYLFAGDDSCFTPVYKVSE